MFIPCPESPEHLRAMRKTWAVNNVVGHRKSAQPVAACAPPHYPAELITISRPTVNTPRATMPMKGFPSGKLSLTGAVASEGLPLLKSCFSAFLSGAAPSQGLSRCSLSRTFSVKGLHLHSKVPKMQTCILKFTKMQLCAPKFQKYNSALQNLRNIILHFKFYGI